MVLLVITAYGTDVLGIDWANVSRRAIEQFSTGSIAGAYEWKWRVLTDPISIHDNSHIAELVDAPVVNATWPIRFSQVMQNVIQYAQSSQIPQSASDEAELAILRRVLFERTALPWRWLPCESEYPTPLRPSRYVLRYRQYAMTWALTADKVEEIRRHGGTQAEITRAEAEARYRRHLWETEGYRKELTVIGQRYEFLTRRDGAVWFDAEGLFMSNNIPYLVQHGLPAPVELEDMGSLQWQRDEVLDQDGRTRSLESTVVRIGRPWLDERVLFNLCWEWSPSGPANQELISDGSSSKPQGLFPSFVERAVLVRFPEEPELVYVVAFVGEVLPKLPPECGVQNAHRGVAPTSPHRRSAILNRLRDGTF